MPIDHPDPSTLLADRQPDQLPQHPSPRSSPLRDALLWRFSDPEDAATVRRTGNLLYELVNESGEFGPDDEENRVRAALLFAARDLLLDLMRMGNGAQGAKCGTGTSRKARATATLAAYSHGARPRLYWGGRLGGAIGGNARSTG